MKRIVTKLALGILTFWAAMALFNYFYPLSPIEYRTEKFEKHAFFSFDFPFIHPYYLLLPRNYDPAQEYPLVLDLHGASKKSRAGFYLAHSEHREAYETFILFPTKALNGYWMSSKLWGPSYPDRRSIDLAIDILDSVVKDHSVDAERLYVVGGSNGGIGALGAAVRYPNLFAGLISVAGGWSPRDAGNLKDLPMWVFHGQDDDIVPFRYSLNLIIGIRNKGGQPKFTAIENAGHAIYGESFFRRETWDWLFAQKRSRGA